MMIGDLMHRFRRWLRRPTLRGSLTALGVYFLATVVVTYPVAFRLNEVIAGFPARDGWQYTWWLWFSRRLLLDGRGLADLHLLNHPVGLHHPFQWTLTYLSALAVPVGSILSPAATFNLMVLASFVLSGLAAYHLCRGLTASHWAALVGGAVFAFAPNRLGHAMAGWLPQMTVYVYPWYTLVLIRTIRRPTVGRAVLLGILAGVGANVYVMHIAYFLLPITVVITIAEMGRLRSGFFSQTRILLLALALALCLIIAVPPMIPLIRGRLGEKVAYLSTTGIVGHSADLLAFVTPSPYHPIMTRLGFVPSFAQHVFADREALRARAAYLGLIPVLLGGWGLLRTRPRPWRWGVLFVTAAILSLGPILVAGGEAVQYTVDDFGGHVLLPYSIFREIPLLDWGRTPGRLNAVGMLGLAVLVAYGLARILERVDKSGWRRALLALAGLGLVLFEFLPIWPFPTGDARIPSVVRHVDQGAGNGAILHLPMERRRVNHRALYFQTFSEQPIVGGEVLRMLPETPPWWRSIEGLVRTDEAPDIVPRPSAAQRLAWLRHFEVDWVLLHLLEEDDEAKYRPPLEALLGPSALEDDSLAAFAVPRHEAQPEATQLYTLSEGGWTSAEQDRGIWRRWLVEESRLYVYSTKEERGSLRFNVDSHLSFPMLELRAGEETLDQLVVGDRVRHTTRPFTLTKGMNVITFRAPGGCPEVLDDARCWQDALLEPPDAEAVPPCDARTTCRTFVLDQMSFVPVDGDSSGGAATVSFGHQMWLRDWMVSKEDVRPGSRLTVTMAWESTIEVTDRHVVFVHLLSDDGELVAQHDDAPVGSILPPGAWPSDTTFRFPVSVGIPADLTPGEYQLQVGIYLWPEMERLAVPSSPDNAFDLGTVEITP